MGFLDRLIGAANKVDDVKTDHEFQVFHDRSFERAEDVMAAGTAIEGRITGIQGRLDDSETDLRYRVEWSDPEPRAAGVRYGTSPQAALRLGSTVPLRVDGDRAVVDAAATAGAPVPVAGPGRMTRGVPDAGVIDSSLNSMVLSRLKKWPADTGTVVSLSRNEVAGMRTQNWDITVSRSDGTQALVKRDFVPAYVRFLVHPGATLPLVVDPKDPGRAQVDWPGLALANSGGSWRDHPPEGSVAALDLMPPQEVEVSRTAGDPVDLTVPAESAATVEGVSLEQWALVEAALIKDRVPPGQYDAYATERYGVPAGRWTAVRQQWERRRDADWRVGAAFGEAFEVARKELKKRT